MNVAIIPARSGSKRIPGKNIREFCGKPMVAWSIEAARRSNLFDDIIVSTDCDEIASVAEAHGATAPFRRPAELADDFTPTIPVIRHAIDWLIEHGSEVKGACCIYATAPFLHHSDLQTGLRLLQEDPNLEFAFSVTEFNFPIQRALKAEGGRIAMFQPQHRANSFARLAQGLSRRRSILLGYRRRLSPTRRILFRKCGSRAFAFASRL